MRSPQLRLSMEHELIIDQFAGGGGASLGIELALGRSPDIAINHDPEALYAAQGFPADYRIEITYGGARLTKSAQIRMCGNSVSPPVAAALIRTNFAHEQFVREAA